MSRPDWGALQQEYIAEYTRSGISPVAWCEARGLNYATARRYIKKTPKNAQTEMCKTAQKSAQKKSAQTAQKRNEKSQEKKPVFDAGLNEGDAEEFSFCPDEFGISDQQSLFRILCKYLFSEVAVQAVTELDNKAAHCHTPVPQWHRPFL